MSLNMVYNLASDGKDIICKDCRHVKLRGGGFICISEKLHMKREERGFNTKHYYPSCISRCSYDCHESNIKIKTIEVTEDDLLLL